MSETPNPGSDEAIALGCTCPVLDNAHGRGYMGKAGIFVYTAGCPVHSPSPDPIFRAEAYEEQCAAEQLRAARDKDDLKRIWDAVVEHQFPPGTEGREVLSDVYSDVLVRFAPMARAG